MKALRKEEACIYCGDRAERRSKEHIVAKSLGGRLVLPGASCGDCRDKTSDFETSVAKHTYVAFRAKRGYPTRHGYPRTFNLLCERVDGYQQVVPLPADRFPSVYPTLVFPAPGILTGAQPTKNNPPMQMVMRGRQEELNAIGTWLRSHSFVSFEMKHEIKWGALACTVAKTAHSYTVAAVGHAGYRSLLAGLILGKDEHLSYLVGGYMNEAAPAAIPGLGVRLSIWQDRFLVVDVSLLRGSLPIYRAVSGEIVDLALVQAAIEARGINEVSARL